MALCATTVGVVLLVAVSRSAEVRRTFPSRCCAGSNASLLRRMYGVWGPSRLLPLILSSVDWATTASKKLCSHSPQPQTLTCGHTTTTNLQCLQGLPTKRDSLSACPTILRLTQSSTHHLTWKRFSQGSLLLRTTYLRLSEKNQTDRTRNCTQFRWWFLRMLLRCVSVNFISLISSHIPVRCIFH